MAVLSVVIITLNEMRNLPRCLESVKAIADEVLVVDSGSNDGTVEFANSWGAKVFHHPFQSYADQKNWAAEQATQTYVLSLDADEALSEALAQEIQNLKAMAFAGKHEVWSLPRLTNYCGTWVRHGGWYPDRKIRLWKKGRAKWSTGVEGKILHESLVPSEGVEVASLHSDLLHFSYHTAQDHHRQWAHFSRVGAKDALRMGRKSISPWGRAALQWTKNFMIQGGWHDGRAGWDIARRSALSSYWKWRQVRSLKHGQPKRKIGVVRTDAIGDNVVTLPVAGAIKHYLPEVEVVWICKPYVAPLIRRSRHINEVRCWEGGDLDAGLFDDLDAVVFASHEPALMKCAAKRSVPIRVVNGRRWSGFLWGTRRIWRSRKHRPEHEALQSLGLLHGLDLPAKWRFPETEDWFSLTGLSGASWSKPEASATRDWVVLHPGNHGSANGWSLQNFKLLAHSLVDRGIPVAITGSEHERPSLSAWLEDWKDEPKVLDAVGKWTLDELMDFLVQARCVVASSTGPLHLAAALGSPVVGLYRSDAPFWPERWAPLGDFKLLSTRELDDQGGLKLACDQVQQAVLEVLRRGV